MPARATKATPWICGGDSTDSVAPRPARARAPTRSPASPAPADGVGDRHTDYSKKRQSQHEHEQLIACTKRDTESASERNLPEVPGAGIVVDGTVVGTVVGGVVGGVVEATVVVGTVVGGTVVVGTVVGGWSWWERRSSAGPSSWSPLWAGPSSWYGRGRTVVVVTVVVVTVVGGTAVVVVTVVGGTVVVVTVVGGTVVVVVGGAPAVARSAVAEGTLLFWAVTSAAAAMWKLAERSQAVGRRQGQIAGRELAHAEPGVSPSSRRTGAGCRSPPRRSQEGRMSV